MKFKSTFIYILVILYCIAGSLSANLAVKGETIYTMAGDPITAGVVLIEDGKISKIGTADEVSIPNGWDTLSAAVVTPGLVDAHTTVGLSGMLNQAHDQEQVEKSAPMQPELRAIDAYNGRDELVDWVRNLGVTTVHTGHGPGSLISGQTMVLKTDQKSIGDEVMVPFAMVTGSLGT
ncbi:MAG: hypothetical protein P8L44_06220, partial [Opitutales bacterium]|nr:hypothetical protein [Opitutales bacterium]